MRVPCVRISWYMHIYLYKCICTLSSPRNFLAQTSRLYRCRWLITFRTIYHKRFAERYLNDKDRPAKAARTVIPQNNRQPRFVRTRKRFFFTASSIFTYIYIIDTSHYKSTEVCFVMIMRECTKCDLIYATMQYLYKYSDWLALWLLSWKYTSISCKMRVHIKCKCANTVWLPGLAKGSWRACASGK